MKVVAMMPYWKGYYADSAASASLGMRRLGGRHLLNYSLQLLNRSSLLDDIVIFTSDAEIAEYIEPKLNYRIMERPAYLDDLNIRIEQIIDEFLQRTDADIIVLLHPTSPFLKKSTLDECIESVRSGTYDSAFTAYSFKKFAWYRGRPLNYRLDTPTPHRREIEPIIVEQSSLYVFSRATFLEAKKRVGGKVHIQYVDHFEGHEITVSEDFDLAELIVNSGMFSEMES